MWYRWLALSPQLLETLKAAAAKLDISGRKEILKYAATNLMGGEKHRPLEVRSLGPSEVLPD